VIQEFKDFINKGNLVDIAVGLVLAVAFGAVINAFMEGIVAPFIGMIFGKPSFSQTTLKIGDGVFLTGRFLNEILTFVLTAIVMFLLVKAYNNFRKSAAPAEPSAQEKLLMEIRDSLRAR
jgi:large conductance mechanosensitive channel